MTRLTPAANGGPPLDELRPYNATIVSIEPQPSGKFGTAIKLVLHVDEVLEDYVGDGNVWAFVNYADPDGNAKLGKSPAGIVSGFRSFCNAAAGRAESARVAWFDDDTLMVGYPDDTTFRLTAGIKLRIAGEYKDLDNGDKRLPHATFPEIGKSAAVPLNTTPCLLNTNPRCKTSTTGGINPCRTSRDLRE